MKNRILVVEDEKAISDLICMNLEVAGYEAIPVYEGDAAEQILWTEKDLDLALVDVMLPGKDGFALMDCFKKRANKYEQPPGEKRGGMYLPQTHGV